MNSKLLSLVIFVACSLIPSVRSSCETLNSCMNNIENGVHGTWSYQTLPSRPATEEIWNTTWHGICNSKPTRLACLDNTTIGIPSCNVSLTKKKAETVRRKAELVCSRSGRKYFKRLYTQSGTCLGNLTAVDMWRANHKSCKETLASDIQGARNATEKCEALITAKNCDVNYGENLCGYLAQWVLNNGWKIVIWELYNGCYAYVYPPTTTTSAT